MSVIFRNRHALGATLGLFLPLVLRITSAPTANLSFFLLAVYATLGRAQAIQALAMTWFLTMISPGVAPAASLGSVGRYVIFFAAFLSVFFRSSIVAECIKVNKVTLFTIGLGFFFIVHSILVSPMPDVSILKAASWVLVTVTLCSAWSGLTQSEREKLCAGLYFGLVAIMVISLPLFVLPTGYLRNGSGFQGILNHPQAFGPTMAILGAISGSKLFAEKTPSWQYLGVFALSLVFIMASEARTAGLAVVIGLVTAVLLVPFLTGRRIRYVLPGLKSRRVWGIVGVAMTFVVVFAPSMSEKASQFISKSDRADSTQSIVAAYDKSRGGLVDRMFVNINENLLTGIGFGIASAPDTMEIERDPVFSLPISAAMEKGVLPIAVVEELGIPGAILIFTWMVWLIRRAAHAGITPLVLVTTVLLINMGENTFFSPGGLGMLLLIAFSWAVTKSKKDVVWAG